MKLRKINLIIFISVVLLVSIGIVMAHKINKNDDVTESDDMTMIDMHNEMEKNVAMMGMMNEGGMSMHMNEMHDVGDMPEEMMGKDEHMSMMKTMKDNIGEMHEEMMNNETLREEISEHMEKCPIMGN